MSYEGYVQVLCTQGHLNEYDYLDWEEIRDRPEVTYNIVGGTRTYQKVVWSCPDCKSPVAFVNHVDTTNGTDYDTGEGVGMKFEVISPAKTETCNLGITHLIEEARYKIPQGEK